tara:strand:- start:117 stop:524 length:408 start_codon:yes stop_codon:yes gene_type:complete
MARIVLTDANITINSVDLSTHIASVTITSTDDIIETSAFGDSSKTRVAGLRDNSVALEFHQDFAATNVEATIYPLLGTATTIVVKPTSDAVGAANPSYTFSALVSEWTPLSGAIGELSTASVTWSISGAITKATS